MSIYEAFKSIINSSYKKGMYLDQPYFTVDWLFTGKVNLKYKPIR